MKRSLEETEGVKEAKVSYEERRAWVVVDQTVTDEALIRAVNRSGRFTGEILSREPAVGE